MENNKTKKNSAAVELFEWAQSLIWVLLFLVMMNAFFVRISGVSGDSMYPTLENGDMVLTQVCAYEQPQRGDIVIINAPHFDEEPLVKRVIGIEGDIVEVFDDGSVYVNGEQIDEAYVNESVFDGGSTEYPCYIGEGEVFVMGDTRNYSADSRMRSLGVLSTEDVIGKVFFRMWPIGSFGGI